MYFIRLFAFFKYWCMDWCCPWRLIDFVFLKRNISNQHKDTEINCFVDLQLNFTMTNYKKQDSWKNLLHYKKM